MTISVSGWRVDIDSLSRCQATAVRCEAHYRALADFTFAPHSEPGS